MPPPRRVSTPQQNALADVLLELCQGSLKKDAEKGYVTLDEQIGKSRSNKNAVSILQGYVSFMVADGASEAEAEALGLTIKPNKTRRALRFPALTIEGIMLHREFFRKLLLDAKRESQKRQSR